MTAHESQYGVRLESGDWDRFGKVVIRAVAEDGTPFFADRIDPYSAEDREEFLDAIAEAGQKCGYWFTGSPTWRDEFAVGIIAMKPPARNNERNARPEGEIHAADPAVLLAAMAESVRADAEAMLRDPDLIRRIVDDIAVMGVAGETRLTSLLYVVGTSRLLPSPLGAIVQAASSTGKSYSIETTARLFPPEAVIFATEMTPKALYHMPPGSLAHRFIVGGERSRQETDETADRTKALREMLSTGRLSKLVPEKSEGGGVVTRQIEIEGPIAYVESTTVTKIFNEDANRMLRLMTDETPAQTRRILTQIAGKYDGTAGAKQAERERIIERHHAAQRMLRPCAVVIPFAARLVALLSGERVEARRAVQQLFSGIEAITLLHQFQRGKDANGALIATEQDYAIALQLLEGPMALALGGGISPAARRLYDEWLLPQTAAFTVKAICQQSRRSRESVRGCFSELNDAGLIEVEAPGRGTLPALWRTVKGADADLNQAGLPSIAEVFTC